MMMTCQPEGMTVDGYPSVCHPTASRNVVRTYVCEIKSKKMGTVGNKRMRITLTAPFCLLNPVTEIRGEEKEVVPYPVVLYT